MGQKRRTLMNWVDLNLNKGKMKMGTGTEKELKENFLRKGKIDAKMFP